VLAIAHLHSLEILYRDLKPDNVLLTPEGNVRLADMGAVRGLRSDGAIRLGKRSASAKTARGARERRMTISGTHGYRAPEVYARAYGKPADWWCVGLLLIEMRTGHNPMRGANRDDSERLARTAAPCFPPDFGDEAKATARALLTLDPKQRLGSPRAGTYIYIYIYIYIYR